VREREKSGSEREDRGRVVSYLFLLPERAKEGGGKRGKGPYYTSPSIPICPLNSIPREGPKRGEKVGKRHGAAFVVWSSSNFFL